MGEAKKRKLSRDAQPEEILSEKHGPVQATVVDAMKIVVTALQETLGDGFHITLFVAENEATEGRADPRMNYMSTAHRGDMIAVLKSFILRQEQQGQALDKIADAPPTGSRQ